MRVRLSFSGSSSSHSLMQGVVAHSDLWPLGNSTGTVLMSEQENVQILLKSFYFSERSMRFTYSLSVKLNRLP